MFVGLDEVIAANAEKLFPGMEIESASLFRVCRDAEVELDDDEGMSKRALVEQEVQQRRFEPVVRLEVQPNADPQMMSELMQQFALTPDDVYEMQALLDYTTLFEIAGLGGRAAARPAVDTAAADRARGRRRATSSLRSGPATSCCTSPTTASTPASSGSSARPRTIR